MMLVACTYTQTNEDYMSSKHKCQTSHKKEAAVAAESGRGRVNNISSEVLLGSTY